MDTIKLKLIYPKWNKLPGQTTFNLPPHGPVAFAATLPEYVDISFTDENVEPIDFDEECDLVALSMMLTTQVKRGWAIADEYHKRGKTVLAKFHIQFQFWIFHQMYYVRLLQQIHNSNL